MSRYRIAPLFSSMPMFCVKSAKFLSSQGFFLQEPIIGLDLACEYAKLPESVQGTTLPEWSLTELGCSTIKSWDKTSRRKFL
jgi:hypothetical protein